jgi:hypothetical protein
MPPGPPTIGIRPVAVPQPTKSKVQLNKRLKTISWTRYIIPPKDHPQYKETIWETVPDIKLNQAEVEELFDVVLSLLIVECKRHTSKFY